MTRLTSLTSLCFVTVWFSAAGFAATSDVADAAMKKNSQTLRSLLQQKADVNAPQADGATALHWAARWDDLEMAQSLIRAGANVRAANNEGATPMFLATLNGNAQMIELLLTAGVDPNAPVLSHGETALMMTARTGRVDAVKALLDHGANINSKEHLRGTTALMWAADEGQAAVVRLLLDHRAEINAKSTVLEPIKRSGLGFARQGPNGKQLRDSIGGLTALHFAARQGAVDVARMLVDAGADLRQTSADGSAPLLLAIENGHYDVAIYLVERGADPNQANPKGWSPLYMAVANRDAFTTTVPPRASEGALDFIKLLLDRRADPNHRIKLRTEMHQGNQALWLEEDGATPLLRAAFFGDLTVVKLLLEHGADPSITTFDHTTPLMVASGVGWAFGLTRDYSEEESFQLVKLLLDLGANVNQANDHGVVALHGAAFKGANRIVQLLVDRGADLTIKDKGENYGLDDASRPMTALNWAEGVTIAMNSGKYQYETVALLSRLMQERGIPVVHFKDQPRGPIQGIQERRSNCIFSAEGCQSARSRQTDLSQ